MRALVGIGHIHGEGFAPERGHHTLPSSGDFGFHCHGFARAAHDCSSVSGRPQAPRSTSRFEVMQPGTRCRSRTRRLQNKVLRWDWALRQLGIPFPLGASSKGWDGRNHGEHRSGRLARDQTASARPPVSAATRIRSPEQVDTKCSCLQSTCTFSISFQPQTNFAQILQV